MAADETGATGNEDVAFHIVVGSPRRLGGYGGFPVSYTHLTLPTSDLV
mgnify:CR=1 FL=1